MINKMFWFLMIMNTIVIVLATLGYVTWLWVAIYFAISDYGQMIDTYIENNFEGEK